VRQRLEPGRLRQADAGRRGLRTAMARGRHARRQGPVVVFERRGPGPSMVFSADRWRPGTSSSSEGATTGS
jgi:hypothetical protein